MPNAYWVLNLGLLVSFVLTKVLLKLSKKWLDHAQRLQLARFTLINVLIASLMTPLFLQFIPHKPAIWQPLTHTVRVSQWVNWVKPLAHLSVTQPGFSISINTLLLSLLLAGMSAALLRYAKNLYQLLQLTQKSYSLHAIYRVRIFISEVFTTPFCFGFGGYGLVVIPNALLTHADHFKWSLRHELQHLRQHDALWLHVLRWLQIACFFNPFIYLWQRLFSQLQEFACDEALVRRQPRFSTAYAECLLHCAHQALLESATPEGVLGFYKSEKSLLLRRINVILTKPLHRKKGGLAVSIALSLLSACAFSYEVSEQTGAGLSASRLEKLAQDASTPAITILATPQVQAEFNTWRTNPKAHAYITASLERMKIYQNQITPALKARKMPEALLAVPLVESGYQALPEKSNPVRAAGIWQIIPETAVHYGLNVGSKYDERFDMKRATDAALNLLQDDYRIFNNWKLAVIAYEVGEQETMRLIRATGSRDPWVLARSAYAPKSLSKVLAMFEAGAMVIHDPQQLG